MNNYIEIINKKLNEYLSPKYPEEIYEAMAYSVNAGGKRLRPVLLLSACEAMGGKIEKAYPFACAIEMIHTYSLIHDDLPAMDNDDLRRGVPTCHKRFDEATAILAGDALLNFACEIMFEETAKNNDKSIARAACFISHGAGINGMIGGQVVDVASQGKETDAKTLIYIHRNKTAALIKAALKAGAVIGGADEAQLNIFDLIGDKIGIAFQIKDDILDVTSSTEILGKPVLSDIKNEKTTYISLFGLEKAREDYLRLSKESLELILRVTDKSSSLYSYCNKLIDRIK